MQLTPEVKKTINRVVEERVRTYRAAKIPEETLRKWAWEAAEAAVEKYNERDGATLQQWTRWHLRKMSSQVRKRVLAECNVGHIPEHRAFHVVNFKQTEAKLTLKLSRTPCRCALADELGWSVKEVERMQRELAPVTDWPELIERLGGEP